MATVTDHEARGGKRYGKAEKGSEEKEVSAVPSWRAGELDDQRPISVAGHKF